MLGPRPPVHTLPVELLSRIFRIGSLPDFSDSPFLLKPDQSFYSAPNSNPQVVISHVCKRWRQIALRTPTLWTSLHIRRASDLDRAKVYLSRCSTSAFPLDVLVDTVAVADHYPGITLCRDELEDIFDIILPHLYRWRSFFLKLRDSECKNKARTRLCASGPAPVLETLQLYHFEEWTSQDLYLSTVQPPMMLFDGIIPNLKNVSLIGVNLTWSRTPYLRGLRNLELALHAESVRPSYAQWEALLRNSPDLEKLSLHYSGPKFPSDVTIHSIDESWPPNKDLIELKNLRDINIVDLDPDYLCLIFEHLNMPNVKRLGLDLPEQDFTVFVDLISGARRRSISLPAMKGDRAYDVHEGPPGRPRGYFETVERLAITSLECSPDAWRKFLPSIRALQVMEVDFRRMGEGFYEALFDLVDERVPSIYARESSVTTTDSSHSDCTLIESGSPPPPCRKQRVRLLPNLDTIQLSGLNGTRVKELIAFSQRLGCSVKRWVVKWDENRRGRDLVLDRLVEKGWRESWNGTGLKIGIGAESEKEVADEAPNEEHAVKIDVFRGHDDDESDDESNEGTLDDGDDLDLEDDGEEEPPDTPADSTSSSGSSSP